MSTLAIHRELTAIALPEPRTPIAIRTATLADVPFIDQLQKQHNKMVGFMPFKQLEKYVSDGHALLAVGCQLSAVGQSSAGSVVADSRPPKPIAESPLGYCIARDQYFKRDDCGIVYQLNVTPGKQRHLVGAALLQAVFDRAAYGCKLFCCWCAQDIAANYFWEAMGFVPLAFRTGSRGRKSEGPRTHIFWQKRIRSGDTETPYWFPAKTSAGAIGEDRIVLPIPPGTHWRDAKPAILPGVDVKMLECHSREGGNPASATGSRLRGDDEKERRKL